MIRNYLKIAWRSLLKNKTSSFINIVGLTTGLTCCLLMVLYMQHELSYDKFQKNGDRVVRVIMEYKFGEGEITKGNFTSTKVFPAFKANFPEVVDGVRMADPARVVKFEDRIFNEEKFYYADSTFFNLFPSFTLIRGQANQVLKGPNMVVMTRSAAIKYFGDATDAVGKTLKIGGQQTDYIVTGIAEDCPSNSQIKFDFVASFSSLGVVQEENYWNANYTTYLLLRDEASIVSLQKKIAPFMKKEFANEPGTYVNFLLEPYTRVHLYSTFDGFEPNSNITYIYIIGAIALLILVIACFTYINLSTARSIERAREVGIRKVAGAVRKQVFFQFIGESVMLTVFSLILSFLLAILILPAFNSLADRSLDSSQLFRFPVLLAALVIVGCISLLAGSYPAFVLSRFQPVHVLKGAFKNTGSGSILRKSLIVFQFSISVFLIVATFIIHQQLQYIQNKNLGYNREHVIVMNIDQKMIDKLDLIKTELKSNQNILAVSKAYNTPVQIPGGYSMYRGDRGSSTAMNVTGCPVDNEFIPATNIEIVAGTNLSKQDLLDADQEDQSKSYYHFILNETAAKALGWKPNEAIGKKIFLGDQRPGEVKAVVRDFHFASLHTTVEPLILFPGGWGNTLLVKTTGKDIAGTISFIETKWKAIAPHRPFDYRFMDEDFQRLYHSEKRTGKVFTIFAGIAILLACLGLFGLAVYATQQRVKEIGIRKVLGASASSITVLLSARFLALVAASFVIASPLAWYVMSKWLEDFAYRVDISWWIFVLAGLAVTVITLLTVGLQALKAALSNPATSLRSE
ncbi:MAG: ABC transporter permease [Chitinophagaceae bacterium]|nr:ABC transporter permease [Chitinophagaceae bacterium]